MPQRNVATNFTFEQQRQEINLLASDFWTQKGTVDTAASTYLKHDGSNNFTGGTLNVPNAFTISANSGSGTLTISGNLDVTGTTTTVNTANLEVTDKNILIAKGSTSDAQADGAGITIDSATDITFNFVDANDALVSSIGLEATTFLKAARGQFIGDTSPTTGSGVEINAPDATTGQIIAYNRGTASYNQLRLRAATVPIYTGSTNALVGTFNSTGLSMESGKTITGVLATAAQPNVTSVGTLSSLSVGGIVTIGTNTTNTSDAFTIVDPGDAFMSIRSDQHADGNSQFLDFCVGTGNRASGNMVGSIRAQIPTGTTAGGTLQGELSFWSNSGDSISQNMTLHPDGSLTVGTATKQLGTRFTSDGNIKMTQATSNTRRLFALPGTDAYTINLSGGSAIGFTRDSNNNDFLIFETHTQGASHAERMRLTHEGYLHLSDSSTSQGTNTVGGQSVTGQDYDPIFKLLTQTQNSWLMQLRSDTATGSNGIFMRAGNSSSNYTMYLTGTDEANKHLLVRGDGIVQKPKQPLAIIGTTINNHTPTAGSIIQFDYAQTNRGNHYDTSTYKWTCPVEGDYMVIFNHAVSGWVGDIALMKNTTDIRKLEMRENGANKDGDSDWQAGSYSFIVPCNANDELWWKVTNVYSNTGMGGAGAMLDGYNHVYYDSVTYYLMG